MSGLSPRQLHRLGLVSALTHAPTCPAAVLAQGFPDSPLVRAARQGVFPDLLAEGVQACFACSAILHLLDAIHCAKDSSALARERYVQNVVNQASLLYVIQHPDLDTWTQADFDHQMRHVEGRAERDWDREFPS